MTALRIVLFVFGYPTAIVVISRFVPVVREQRTRWIVAHHLAVIAIIVGWATESDWKAVTINSSWLVASTIWYLAGARRKQRSAPAASR